MEAGEAGVAGNDPTPEPVGDQEAKQVVQAESGPQAAPSVDPALLEVFAAEAAEGIDRCAEMALALEERPEDKSLLSELFRELYTLHGSAAMVGLTDVAAHCGAAAELLEDLAAGKIRVSSKRLVDFLVRLTDSLNALLGRNDRTDLVLADVAGEIGQLRASAGEADAEQLLEAFAEEAPDILDQCGEIALALEADPYDVERLRSLFREFHTLKGAAGAVGLEKVVEQLHAGETLLEALIGGDAQVSGSRVVDFLLRLTDSVSAVIAVTRGAADQEHLILANPTDEVADLLGAAPAPLREEEGVRPSSRVTPDERIARIADRRRESGQTDTSLRLLLRRLEQAIHAAAREERKPVRVRCTGADIRVPRGLAKKLYPPLLHLVRNAVVHGIEPPAQRVHAGKPASGEIRVVATEEPGFLSVEVSDDGAGLQLDRIRRRAEALGLCPDGASLDEERLFGLIFRPGFSTREAAGQLAGRGVGLDVVLRSVSELGGSVSVDSVAGRGTTFRVRVPRRIPS